MAPAIEITELSKEYQNRPVVKNITMSIPSGSVFGFLGPNGAGKTTTIRMLLRLTKPTSGTAKVLGTDIGEGRPAAAIGAMVEQPAFFDYLTGHKNIEVFAKASRVELSKPEIDALLEKVGLSGASEKKAGGYSLGMKQRLAVALALIGDPSLLFLDEPTNGLDPEGAMEMRNLLQHLRSEGKTIFLSTHLLSEMERICTHVGILKSGVLLRSGELSSLLSTASIRFRVSDPNASIKLLPNSRQLENNWIACGDPQVTLPEATRILGAHGVHVLETTSHKPNLESVYFDAINTTTNPADIRC